MYKYKRIITIIIAVLLILSMLAAFTFSFAEGGNNPLFINESTPADGATDVSIDTEIKINFSKNVVNMSVKDNNAKCFSIKDNESNEVPIEVKMADDQIERDKRNDIILVPTNGLQEGKKYTIIISKDLKAKNGRTLEEEKTISFSTKGYVEENDKDGQGIGFLPVIIFIALIVVILFIKKKRSN